MPEYLRKQEWREHVDEHDYNAILLWREFRNIYDEVTQQSSLPLYLVVREALKNLKQETVQVMAGKTLMVTGL